MRIFTVLLCLLSFQAGAQSWQTGEGSEKSQNNFKTEQKAFYDFCEKHQIIDGKYERDGKLMKFPGLNQFKRKEFHLENLITTSGTLPNYNKFLQNTQASNNRDQAKWISLGLSTTDGGYSGIGRINTIAFNPNNEDEIFIGTPGGGLWRTTTGGNNWEPLTDNLVSIGITDVYISPNYADDQTLFIASGDGDGRQTPSSGVYKSTDQGQNWELSGLSFATSEMTQITRLLGHPENPAIIYASTTQGLFKTIDGGANWNKINDAVINDLELKPNNPEVIYAGSKSYGDNSALKVYRSTNGGTDWDVIWEKGDGNRIALAVTPDNPDALFVLSSTENSSMEGVYKSKDSGDSFEQLVNGSEQGNNFFSYSFSGDVDEFGIGWYSQTIAVNPQNENEIYVGCVNTWKTNDGGTSWECVNHWVGENDIPTVHADKHAMVYSPGSNHFYEGNDGGIYKSIDQGVSWIDLSNTLVISQMYQLGVDAQNPEICITGLQDNGTKLKLGDDWYDVLGGDGMDCMIDYTDSDIQYASSQYGNFFCTFDAWENKYYIKPDGSARGDWLTPIVMDPNAHMTIYLGYAGLWKAPEGSMEWELISPQEDVNVNAIAVAPSDSKVIYFSRKNRIFKTTNGGNDWSDISNSSVFESHRITAITVKDTDPNTIWITLSRFSEYGVLKSTDGGNTWENYSEGLPEFPVYSIVENKLNTKETELYAGTLFGAYCKIGDGAWFSYNNGLPNMKVTEVEIYYGASSKDSRLMASTFGRGLWSVGLASGSTTDIESSYEPRESSFFFPNPANNQLTMKLNPGSKHICVRNLNGVEVYAKSNPASDMRINTKNWTAGTYIIQIIEEDITRRFKFVVQH